MSMLAEPRRKVKWSVDPRNSTWSNDESKFGQKMLERMGWSKGKGLGRSEQGATDHVKVKVKNNNYGLGVNTSHEDNWIAHQDDFNDLLAQLNNCHGQNNTESQPEEQKGFSLEEKSKTSKKRVHYMKFAKGKDLSSRSATDLNCIFGKRAKSATDPEQESSSSDGESRNPPSAAAASGQADAESVTKTVTSNLNMQEYFAQRMARLKAARGQAAAPAAAAAEEEEEPKSKKKKKKRKMAEETETLNQAGGKAKKKKSPNEDHAGENSAEDCEEAKVPSKKKKDKMEAASERKSAEEDEETLAVRKKSKKHKKKKQRDFEAGSGRYDGQVA
ncbi:PIN2/TERF1-interacting telomerase inhibitor 1 isoform X1 [Vanacampus margaritifer]